MRHWSTMPVSLITARLVVGRSGVYLRRQRAAQDVNCLSTRRAQPVAQPSLFIFFMYVVPWRSFAWTQWRVKLCMEALANGNDRAT